MASRKTSLYSAHQKLKSVRSKRTGYRRKRMDLAQGRAKTQIKAEANREALGEVVSGLQSISTMAGEWKQQREMDTSINKAFEEMGGIQAKEKTGLNKLFGSKYDYYQGDQKMGAIEKHQALVDYSVGEDKKSKYWNKQSGGDESDKQTAVPPVATNKKLDEFEEKEDTTDPTNASMASNLGQPLDAAAGASKNNIVSKEQLDTFMKSDKYDPGLGKKPLTQYMNYQNSAQGIAAQEFNPDTVWGNN